MRADNNKMNMFTITRYFRISIINYLIFHSYFFYVSSAVAPFMQKPDSSRSFVSEEAEAWSSPLSVYSVLDGHGHAKTRCLDYSGCFAGCLKFSMLESSSSTPESRKQLDRARRQFNDDLYGLIQNIKSAQEVVREMRTWLDEWRDCPEEAWDFVEDKLEIREQHVDMSMSMSEQHERWRRRGHFHLHKSRRKLHELVLKYEIVETNDNTLEDISFSWNWHLNRNPSLFVADIHETAASPSLLSTVTAALTSHSHIISALSSEYINSNLKEQNNRLPERVQALLHEEETQFTTVIAISPRDLSLDRSFVFQHLYSTFPGLRLAILDKLRACARVLGETIRDWESACTNIEIASAIKEGSDKTKNGNDISLRLALAYFRVSTEKALSELRTLLPSE